MIWTFLKNNTYAVMLVAFIAVMLVAFSNGVPVVGVLAAAGAFASAIGLIKSGMPEA